MLDEKSYIIDPLTCVCKLALLYFLPPKTRLAISNYVLHIQFNSCYQWLERMKNGDSRIDLSNLNGPLFRASQWYIVNGEESADMSDSTRNAMRCIMQFCIKGLTKMQTHTYKDDMSMTLILQYLINMLRDGLEDVWDESRYITKSDGDKTLSDTIKGNFDDTFIKSAAEMLTNADNNTDEDDISPIITCLHNLLINRDTKFVNTMRTINTVI